MADHRKSIRHLKRSDPVLATIIDAVGPCRLQLRTDGTHFEALTRSIVFQQLSGKAAGTILSRFNDLYPKHSPTPEAVLATPDERLRSVGLSRQKINNKHDQASKVVSGELPLDRVEE